MCRYRERIVNSAIYRNGEAFTTAKVLTVVSGRKDKPTRSRIGQVLHKMIADGELVKLPNEYKWQKPRRFKQYLHGHLGTPVTREHTPKWC